jgi:hypothetical protein
MDSDIEHTEICTPNNVTVHAHRRYLVKRKYGKKCWKSFSRLKNASQIARYLETTGIGTATSYIKLEDAKNFFERDLKIIKRATNFADR